MVIRDRVDGGLAVSRALGDFDYKQRSDLPPTKQKVSVEPDVTAIAVSYISMTSLIFP